MRTPFELLYLQAEPSIKDYLNPASLQTPAVNQQITESLLKILEPNLTKFYKYLQSLFLQVYHVAAECTLTPQEVQNEWISLLTTYLQMDYPALVNNLSSTNQALLTNNIQSLASYLATNASSATAISSVVTYLQSLNWTPFPLIEELFLNFFQTLQPIETSPMYLTPFLLYSHLQNDVPMIISIFDYIWLLAKTKLIAGTDFNFILTKIGQSNAFIEECWQAYWNPNYVPNNAYQQDILNALISKAKDTIIGLVTTLLYTYLVSTIQNLVSQNNWTISTANLMWFLNRAIITNIENLNARLNTINTNQSLNNIFTQVLETISITIPTNPDSYLVYSIPQTQVNFNKLQTRLSPLLSQVQTPVTSQVLLKQLPQMLFTFSGSLDGLYNLIWFVCYVSYSTVNSEITNLVQNIYQQITSLYQPSTISYPQPTDSFNQLLQSDFSSVNQSINSICASIVPTFNITLTNTYQSIINNAQQIIQAHINARYEMYQTVLQTARQQISNAIAQTSNAIVSTTSQLLQATQSAVDQYLQTNNVPLSSSDRLLLIKALSSQGTQSDSILSTSPNSTQLKQLYDVIDPQVSVVKDTINQQKAIVQTALTTVLLPPLVSGPTSLTPSASSIPPTNTTQLYASLDQLLSAQYNTLNQARQPLASSPSTTNLITYREAEAKAVSLIQQSIVNSQLAPIAALNPAIVYNNVLVQQPSIAQILKANFSTLGSYLGSVVNTVNANSQPGYTNLWGLIPKSISSLTASTYKVALVQNSVRNTISEISNSITAPIYSETAVIRAATTLTQTSFSTLDNAISAPNQILSNVQTAIAGRSQAIVSFASTISHGITSTISAINGLGKLPSQLIATLNPLFGSSTDFANLFSSISGLLGLPSSVNPFDVSNYNVTAQAIQKMLSSQEPGADPSIFGLDLNSSNSSPVSWAQSFAQNNLSLSTGSFMDLVNTNFWFLMNKFSITKE